MRVFCVYMGRDPRLSGAAFLRPPAVSGFEWSRYESTQYPRPAGNRLLAVAAGARSHSSKQVVMVVRCGDWPLSKIGQARAADNGLEG